MMASTFRYAALICVQFPTIHAWPEAPDAVAFLRYPHRHIMHVELTIDQDHDDRDVEFITTGRELLRFCTQQWGDQDIGRLSCEMLAEAILQWAYGVGWSAYRCTVREDGLHGACVEVMR